MQYTIPVTDLLKIKPDTDSPTGYVVYIKVEGRERRNLPAPTCYHIDKAAAYVANLYRQARR